MGFLIIGPGLIGGSIAKALKDKYNKLFAITSSKNYDDFNTIFSSIQTIDNADELIKQAEFIAITTPVSEYRNILTKLKLYNLSDKIIFECGSVKKYVANLCKELEVNWLNLTHPIAGSEKAGFANADSNLFLGRTIILDKNNKHNQEIVEIFKTTNCGEVKYLNSIEHDKIYAKVSHIPQLWSYIFAEFVNKIELQTQDLLLQNQIVEYKQFRRLGCSNQSIWLGKYGIFSLNLDEILIDYNEFMILIEKQHIQMTNFLEIAKLFANFVVKIGDPYKEFYGTGFIDFTAILNYKLNINNNINFNIFLDFIRDCDMKKYVT